MPNLPDAHVGLGHLAMRERRFEDALSEYRQADTGAKELGSLLQTLETDRFSKSRDELERLRAEHVMLAAEASRNEMRGGTEVPTSSGLNAGQVERGRAEVESRIRNLETMTPPAATSPEEVRADVLFFQGNALFNLKRTDEAISVWEDAAGRMRKFAPIHNNLAVAYWMVGRLADAKASLKRAEDLGFKVNPRFKADLETAGIVRVERIPAPAGVVP
jgi:tetratricopeptide (TPR) repeat protein